MIRGSVRAFREVVLGSERDPLGEHGERAAGLLELGQRTPFPLKDHQRRRMEGIARRETPAQELPGLCFGRGRVYRHPLGRKLGPPLEAPLRVPAGDSATDPGAAQVLEQPSPDHLADLRLVVDDEVPGNPADHLGDLVLPHAIPIGHFDLAARQADDRGGARGSRDRNRQVLDERVEGLGEVPVSVDEVQDLVEQKQHGGIGFREDPGERLGTGRDIPCGRPQGRDSPVTRHLARYVDPRGLPALLRIPGTAHEDADGGAGHLSQTGLGHELGNPGMVAGGIPGLGQVIQSCERVGLAATELGEEREHGIGVPRPAREAPEDHSHMRGQSVREAGTGEELAWVAVVLGGGSGDHLLQGDRELVGAEGPAFAHLGAESDDLVPGLQGGAPGGVGLGM